MARGAERDRRALDRRFAPPRRQRGCRARRAGGRPMRTALTAALLLLLSAAATAQEGAAPQRRAPLANVDDVEPAVDVGAVLRVAERPAAQITAQPAAANP